MSEQEDRLIRCFSSVFPMLSTAEIRSSSSDSLAVCGDSLTAITLLAVIQQEFGVEIDPSDLSELDSFEAFQTYLRQLGLMAE
jgi:acyl carrier protein